jgi:hypothetical protein
MLLRMGLTGRELEEKLRWKVIGLQVCKSSSLQVFKSSGLQVSHKIGRY